jgi:hypothetical protein
LKNSHLRVSICAGLFILLLIPFASVSANSPPPRVQVWFVIQADPTKKLEILGAKIIGCPVQDCTEATAEYDSDRDTYGQFIHADNLYYWSFRHPHESDSDRGVTTPYYFRLILQFRDGEKVSQPIDNVPVKYGSNASYRVIVNSKDLTVERTTEPRWPGLNFSYDAFLLTLISESLAGAILWALWKKANAVEILKFAALILAANAISYPVLWSYFLSITQFHSKSDMISGTIVLFGGIVFSILLILAINSKPGEGRTVLAIATIISIPTSCIICVLSGGVGYGAVTIFAEGLPVKTAILLLEICAVLWETLLLYGMTKRKNTLSQMFTTSLIMNIASFAISLLIYNPFA